MDHKAFKQDLTYACKRFQKEGKKFSIYDGHIWPEDASIWSVESDALNPLEMLILVKLYEPSSEMIQQLGSKDYPYKMYELSSNLVLNTISERADISRDNIYAFMDGFENVELSGSKNDFYDIGVYIREKFSPIDSRKEKLVSPKYEAKKAVNTSIGYVIHTRSINGRKKTNAPIVVQVEFNILSVMDDPAALSISENEFKALILRPDFLWELKDSNSKNRIMVPSTYHSNSIYFSSVRAHFAAGQLVRKEFEFNKRKYNIDYTEAEVEQRLEQIEETSL